MNFCLKSLCVVVIYSLTSSLYVWGALPQEYIANQQTAGIWENISDLFTQIQALKKTGNPIPPLMFARLSSDFEQMFPHLPQKPEFKIVYEQCKITTSTLSSVYNLSDFQTFYNQCYTPLNGIIGQINNKYTVSAKVSANPNRGNVPLTVTFDGRGSLDPSRETIPENNYYRSMRDIDGIEKVLGVGPIINYTFNKPGDYIVNFVVRSVHKSDQGIFDGQQRLTIKAEPQIANISVYLGSKKLNADEALKISTTEVKQGIVLDGSSTSPRGGRVIVGHRWDIYANPGNKNTSTNQLLYTKTATGNPANITTSLPSNGRYRVRLTITDNQGATTYQDHILAVSDPVAIIKINPKSGTTSSRFTLDAGASYSVVSKIRSYTREIYDQQGQKLDTLTDKSFNRQFSIPGLYTIKLVVMDMDNKTTQEQVQLLVDSTSPTAQYIVKPSTLLAKPSEFILDAGNSSDIDLANNDSLTYTWSVLSDPEYARIVPDSQDPEQALVTFEKRGTYKVKLSVKDAYGKTDEIIKDILVHSALRPQVAVTPVSAPWGSKVTFSVTANKNIKFYHYDFGDGNKLEDWHQATVSHTYKRTGIYKVKIRAVATDDAIEENILTTHVFVTNKEEPNLGYQVIRGDKFRTVLSTSGTCAGSGDEVYTLSRYQSITIDTKDSTNTQGKKEHLVFTFVPQNATPITKKTNLINYKFDELGCQYIDIILEDTQVLKSVQSRIWFDVINTPPTIGNLRMSFPQYGNEIGIGFSQGKFRDIFSTTNMYDPLIVKIIASNIRDPDGYVKYLTWYYYRTDDPDRRLVLKTTPPSTSFIYFSLPRIAGEYSFGVEAIDNDGNKVNSQELIGDGPIVFFPPERNDADIPYVTFKVDQNNIKVGEEVHFEVVSRIVSNKQDFDSSKTMRYDFDGDGEYDLTTKDSSITYMYEKPGTYKPKVKVTYRGKSNRVPALTEEINVEQGLKTDFIYTVLDKTVIFKNTSIGQIKDLSRCMDMTKCLTDNNYVLETSDYHSFTYPDYGRYVVKLEVKDEYGNTQTQRKIITIPSSSGSQDTQLVTIPQAKTQGKNIEINVGKQLKNTILFYVQHTGSGQCFIDTNILLDSNYNGKQDDDKDIACNQLKSLTVQSQIPDVVARLTHTQGSGVFTQDILIHLIDSKPLILDKYKDAYNQLDMLTKDMKTPDEETSFMKTLLIQLKSNLGDKTDSASLILQIQDLLDNPDLDLTAQEKQSISNVIVGLSDAPVIAAQGGNDYETYKSNIKLLLKGVGTYFVAIEQANGDQTIIKNQLDEIYQFAQLKTKSSAIDAIDTVDFEEIKSNLCQIANYYQVSTKTCGNPNNDTSSGEVTDVPSSNTSDQKTSTVRSKILKIILIVLGLVALVFVGLIVIFAIKAKREQQSNEKDDDE